MTTNFPAQIDSFDLKQPQQLIESKHINDVTESIVSVQVHSKALEENINAHLTQAIGAHEATSISIADIIGLNTTNLQDSLSDLKTQIDGGLAALAASTAANIVTLQENINLEEAARILADSNEEAARIAADNQEALDRIEADGYLQADIDQEFLDRAAADTALQVNIDIETSARIAADLQEAADRAEADGYIQADIDNHVGSSSAIHGVTSELVGTTDAQILEKKTIISDFTGSKMLLFTEEVSDEEKEFFNKKLSPGASQIEVRNRSVALIISVTQPGLTRLEFSESNFFQAGDQIDIINPPSAFITTATVASIISPTLIELDNTYGSILNTHFVINKSKSDPLFVVEETGAVRVQELSVATAAFGTIDLQDDVMIEGSLTTSGTTSLQDSLTVLGSIINSSFLNVGTDITAGNGIQAENLTINNNATIAGKATISDTLNVANTITSGSVNSSGNLTADGYLNIYNDAVIQGGTTINDFLTVGQGAQFGGNVTVSQDMNVDGDLDVVQDLHISGAFISDGYSIIKDSLVVEGDLLISGAISSGDAIDASNVTFDVDGYENLALDTPFTAVKVEGVVIASQTNLEAHLNETSGAHDAYTIAYNPDAALIATDVKGAIDEVQTNLETSEGYVLSTMAIADAYLSADISATEAYVLSVANDHFISTTAHDALNLIFDGYGSNLISTNLEAAVKETQINLETADQLRSSDHTAHLNDITAHESQHTTFAANTSTLIATNARDAIEEVQANLDTADGTQSSALTAAIESILNPYVAMTSGGAVLKGARILADTSGGSFTIDLPTAPSTGDTIDIVDAQGSWTDFPIIINGDTKNIDGVAGDFTGPIANMTYTLIYYGPTNDWIVRRPSSLIGG